MLKKLFPQYKPNKVYIEDILFEDVDFLKLDTFIRPLKVPLKQHFYLMYYLKSEFSDQICHFTIQKCKHRVLDNVKVEEYSKNPNDLDCQKCKSKLIDDDYSSKVYFGDRGLNLSETYKYPLKKWNIDELPPEIPFYSFDQLKQKENDLLQFFIDEYFTYMGCQFFFYRWNRKYQIHLGKIDLYQNKDKGDIFCNNFNPCHESSWGTFEYLGQQISENSSYFCSYCKKAKINYESEESNSLSINPDDIRENIMDFIRSDLKHEFIAFFEKNHEKF